MASASEALAAAGNQSPRRDALLLLADATQTATAWALAHPEAPLSDEALSALSTSLGRRLSGEPVQYIRGVQEFWGLPVRVGPGCLVPRPETEHLVEVSLEILGDLRDPSMAEVGCGSGCVLLALASEFPGARILGLDSSPAALGWARRNCAHLPGVLLLRADLAGPPPLRDLRLLLSNPPYITDREWEGLDLEVRGFEPPEALRCWGDPLLPYRRLASWGAECLLPGGHLLAELGVAQARRAGALRRLHPAMAWVRGVRDLAGRLRVGVWRRVLP